MMRLSLLLCALMFIGSGALCQTQVVHAQQGLSAKTSCRFRVSWGGGQNQAWQGELATADGELSDVAPLGLARDSSVSAIATDDNTIQIRQLSPANYDGFDFSFSGKSSALINITMASQDGAAIQWQRSITVAELLSSPLNEPLDDFQHGISVTRVPGDEVQFQCGRDHMVFAPDEPFRAQIILNYTALKDVEGICKLTLVPARQSSPALATQAVELTTDDTGSSGKITFDLLAPPTEGVYDIVIEVDRGSGNRSFPAGLLPANINGLSIPRNNAAIVRRIQLVVLDSQQRQTPAAETYKQIQLLTPAQLVKPANRWMRGINKQGQPLSSQPARLVEDLGLSWWELDAGQWQAIPLGPTVAGEPHVVEIQYASGQPIAVGLSVLDFDANGQVPIQGADSGIRVPNSVAMGMGDSTKGDTESDTARLIATHRLTFWPRSKECYLLVANQSASQGARLGSVRVLSSANSADAQKTPVSAPATNVANASPNRQRLAFCDSANFAQGLNVEKLFDSSVGQPLDDWLVFYQGTMRLVEFLKAHHYQGAVIPVVMDGGALYPSQLLQSSPKNDSGTFQSLGQDPVRKDVLRLLLKIFEREQLTLVPALEFSAPLVDVELTRLQPSVNASTRSFEMIDFSGHPAEADTYLPRYNPLSPVVQSHAINVVDELVRRYAGQAALGGVAIVCRPQTWTLLPGRQYGYDMETLTRFYQSLPQSPPVPDNYASIQQQLFGELADTWVQWRADQMSSFYSQLAGTIRDQIPQARLLLAPVGLHRNEEIQSILSPNLHASVNIEQLLLRAGFDRQQLNLVPGMVLLKSETISSSSALAETRVAENIRTLPDFQTYFASANGESGTLSWHQGSWAHFANLQTLDPFDQQTGRLIRHHQLTPAGRWCRESMADALFQQDSTWLIDGGVSLVMGQEDAISDFASVFAQLPRDRFTDVPYSVGLPDATLLTENGHGLVCPVAVRTLRSGSESWFYCVNDSPWPTNVKLYFQSETDPKTESSNPDHRFINASSSSGLLKNFTSFSNLQATEGRTNGARPFIEVTLPAYGLYGGKFDGGNVIAERFDIEVDDSVHDLLRKKIYQLQAKLNLATRVPAITVLANDDFENAGQASLEGWDAGTQDANTVGLELSEGYQSQSALRMRSDQDSVWIRSNRFTPPVTGRISITVWIKSQTPQQPPLRLAIEGQTRGSTYYRFGAVGALAPDNDVNQIDQEWRRFAVHFDDLPSDQLIDLRVGFDLMGRGDVLIDRVRIYDRWFDEKDAKAMTQLLASALPMLSDAKTFESCRRIVESYWSRFLDEYIEQQAPTPSQDNRVRASDRAPVVGAAEEFIAPVESNSNVGEFIPAAIFQESVQHEEPSRSSSSLLRRWRKNLQLRK